MSSEVAALRQKIAEEYQAAKNGLAGLSCGIARHQFITQKMENMGTIQTELAVLVGSEEAIHIMNETLSTL